MLETKLVSTLQKAMDGSTVRNAVISNNIANVNTPGYKKMDVSFQKELENSIKSTQKLSLRKTNEKHISDHSLGSDGIINVTEISDTSLRTDGNNVDIDIELAALAENTLYFNSLAELLTSQLSLLRTSITEGRR
ncbi:MAG: flagellar basal body rod protein FlgB [Firmicutes bacterium HGW-Firmicutes-12]|nr:MAG: flagellar basal body rod protein FlgB [Firmicutes bacterium HGW-Firmicutes-12]